MSIIELVISTRNRKIKALARKLKSRGIISKMTQCAAFNLPAGHTCPFADVCKVLTDRYTGRQNNLSSIYKCYAANLESAFSAYRKAVWNNYDIARNNPDFIDMAINQLLDRDIRILRIHSGGDFYNMRYIQAWKTIAQALPHMVIFGYTKNPYAIQELNPLDNFSLVYSHGGKWDKKAVESNYPMCRVATTPDEIQYAEDNGILACHTNEYDDYFLIREQKSFYLAVH